MKKIILIITAIVFLTNIGKAQFINDLQVPNYASDLPTSFLQYLAPKNLKSINFGRNEYTYISARVGLIHTPSFISPKEFPYKFIHTPVGEMPLKPASSIDYSLGYYGGFLFNYDFESNENLGLVFGVEAQDYGISTKYTTTNNQYWYKEEYRATTIAIPVYLKYGKDHYKNMRYFYGGFQVIQNMAGRRIEQAEWAQASLKTISLDKGKTMTTRNYAATVGFNYSFYNVEIDYVIGSFLSSGSVVSLYNDNLVVKPYSVLPQGILYIKTGLNVPLSRWTGRKVYAIRKIMRGLFK